MKRSPINKVSKRRSSELRLYGKLAKEWMEVHDCCERCGYNYGLQIHHKKGRIGKLLLDMKYWAVLCHACHRYIEDNREYSYLRGWLLDRLEKTNL